MKKFGHVITAMVTPFDKHGKLDSAKGAELALKLYEEGSSAILVCGTTGESPTLTQDEQTELLRAVKNAAKDRFPVIAGTGTNDTKTTVEKSKRAIDEGADALLLVAPYYNKPPQEGLYRHFAKIAEECQIPIILYNIPGRTGVNISNETIKKLHSDFPHICAVKDAVGNLDQTSALSEMMNITENKTFEIYSGDDSLTLPMIACGASGVISVASHIAGVKINAMIEEFLKGRVKEALQLHLKLLPLFKVLFETTNPIPVKAALKITGFNAGETRLPLTGADESLIEKLREIIKRLKNN